MKSIDIGTMFLVKGEIGELVGEPSFTVERNAFLKAASGVDTEDTLKENGWSYIKYNDEFYLLGEDALKLKNLLTIQSKPDDKDIVLTKVEELRRPMKDGILNISDEKLSVGIIQQLIKNLLGPPSKPGESLCFCAPGDPVDSNLSTIVHRTMLETFLKSLGYKVECVPEALAIIFSERPVAEDDDGEAPFSGLAVSCGAGMMNICFAWKKMPLINFSVARSGDWIDQQTAKTVGMDVSAITRFKETKLDLDNIDASDMKQAVLDIYYQHMIQHGLTNLAEKFSKLDNPIESPLEIVVAGGTATVPGFIEKFKQVVGGLDLPFKVKEI
ncbi:MAG: hypothetical protein KAH23_06620, partial [Kiritimatiellae bacterium]|nr:hypothetical protein [Kiritimatiellia bacterium]